MDAAYAVAERLACTRCIGDHRLREEARAAGFPAECGYCGREGTCVDVAWLADRVHPAFQSAFAPADGALGPADADHVPVDGAGAVAEVAGLDAALAADVHGTLVALFHDADGTASYPADRAYVERPARDLPALHRWATFATAAARRRDRPEEHLLDALKWAFAGLEALATPKGRHALRVLAAGTRAFAVRVDAGTAGWAGPALDAPADLDVDARRDATPAAEDEPAVHVPLHRAGPLNRDGTPALYLALRERTAVTESLAPRGARVVVTRVRLSRGLRVLDLESARKALARTGGFDADRAGSRARARFLEDFADALRATVAPPVDDPAARATQRVGDWLAHATSPRVDGLLTRAAHAPGRVLALFAPAAATGAVAGERERRYAVDALRARYRRVSASGPRTRGPRTPPARD